MVRNYIAFITIRFAVLESLYVIFELHYVLLGLRCVVSELHYVVLEVRYVVSKLLYLEPICTFFFTFFC